MTQQTKFRRKLAYSVFGLTRIKRTENIKRGNFWENIPLQLKFNRLSEQMFFFENRKLFLKQWRERKIGFSYVGKEVLFDKKSSFRE